VAPRRTIAACFAILALLGAGCGEFPDPSASALEGAQAAAASPSTTPSPREFLEIGEQATSREAGEPVGATVPAPKSLERWGWALRSKTDALDVYTDPRGGASLRMSIDAMNPWEQRIAFPIRAVRMLGGEAWYRVLLGIEPNGSNGWVRGDDVTFDRTRHRVVIDLSERVLRHYRNGKLRHRCSRYADDAGALLRVGAPRPARRVRAVRHLPARSLWVLARAHELARRGTHGDPRHGRPV
jgi:hypothetical protein